MSAPNFSARRNARNIYAWNMHCDFVAYCDELAELNDCQSEDLQNDSYLHYDWYDEEKELCLDFVNERMKEVFGRRYDAEDSKHVCDGDNVGTVQDHIDFAGYEIPVRLSIVLESGYYDGFSLDWAVDRISYVYDYDYLPNLEGCKDILMDECELNKGLACALAKKLQKRLDAKIQEIGNKICDVLEGIAPHVLSGVVLSNGEGIYFDAKKSA